MYHYGHHIESSDHIGARYLSGTHPLLFGGGLRGQGGVRTDMIGARRAKGRAEAVKLPDAA
jgi:hypothetical protein